MTGSIPVPCFQHGSFQPTLYSSSRNPRRNDRLLEEKWRTTNEDAEREPEDGGDVRHRRHDQRGGLRSLDAVGRRAPGAAGDDWHAWQFLLREREGGREGGRCAPRAGGRAGARRRDRSRTQRGFHPCVPDPGTRLSLQEERASLPGRLQEGDPHRQRPPTTRRSTASRLRTRSVSPASRARIRSTPTSSTPTRT